MYNNRTIKRELDLFVNQITACIQLISKRGEETMKHASIIFCVFAASLLNACGGSGGGGTTNNSPTTFNFTDYMPLELPPQTTSCTTIKEQVSGPNIGSTTTTTIDGSTETINYTSGPLTGYVITDDASNSYVFYNDGSSFKYLRYNDDIPSTDCILTAHPQAFSWSTVFDGMVKPITNYSVIKNSNSANCTSVPNTTEIGEKALYRIATVSIRNKTYENAIIEYWLDLKYPHVTLQYSGNYGIPIPTASETQGYSVTDVSIFALGEGQIAQIGVDAATGNINEIVEQSDFVCQ